MNYFQHPIFYALLMCVAGIGIPVMAALNGGLGAKLQNPALATTILFMVGGLVSLTYLFFSGAIPKTTIEKPIPKQVYFVYFESETHVSKFGVANANFLAIDRT